MRSRDKTKKEFEELLLEVRKVTRVTTGGRQMSFRAIVAIGNKKGKIGLGVSKGPDVSTAVSKASRDAYKGMFNVPLTKANTVPYVLELKYKACRVRLLPASKGTGLKAGSSVRAILSLAGYENVLSKIIGSNNKLNNALTTIRALSAYKHADHFSALLDTSDSAEKVEEAEKEAAKEKKDGKVAKSTKTSETKETEKIEKKPVAKKAVLEKKVAQDTKVSKAKETTKTEKKLVTKKAPAKKPATKKITTAKKTLGEKIKKQ